MSRDPHMKGVGNLRLTMLDCEVGHHTGHFTITKTVMGWACDECIEKFKIRQRLRD